MNHINDDAPAGDAAQGIEEHKSRLANDIGVDAQRKMYATLKARYAMLGFGLIELADGSFLATRWNCCRALPDLHAAASFYKQVGGAA